MTTSCKFYYMEDRRGLRHHFLCVLLMWCVLNSHLNQMLHGKPSEHRGRSHLIDPDSSQSAVGADVYFDEGALPPSHLQRISLRLSHSELHLLWLEALNHRLADALS